MSLLIEIKIITQFKMPLIKTFNKGKFYTNSNTCNNEYIEHVYISFIF